MIETPEQVSDFIGPDFVWRSAKVSDVVPNGDDKYCVTAYDLISAFARLAKQPASKPWVGLTDEDIGSACGFAEYTTDATRLVLTFISRAIEAKLKEKNT